MAGGKESHELAYSEAMVAAASVVFDVVALPPETPVIKLAQQLGKKTISGAEVIALQAVEQFAMYTGMRPDDALIAEAAEICAGGVKKQEQSARDGRSNSH
ncbi:Shikimate 5-dehydrogenase-like protein [Citrobacter freundii]|nr:Shikimate 5-dehydrogenase-like protein [Citrobacter freundii]